MQTSTMACVPCVLILLFSCFATTLVSSAPATDDDLGSNKNKREAGGPSGLYPFPRIGRSGADNTWFMDPVGKQLHEIFLNGHADQNYPHQYTAQTKDELYTGLIPFPRVDRSKDKQDTDGFQALLKRQSLIAFPRTGRSGNKQQTASNNNAVGNNNGLWFGPRLGRLQKRTAAESPWALVTLRDFPSISSRRQPEAFKPRLGRESNEELWDDYEHQSGLEHV